MLTVCDVIDKKVYCDTVAETQKSLAWGYVDTHLRTFITINFTETVKFAILDELSDNFGA